MSSSSSSTERVHADTLRGLILQDPFRLGLLQTAEYVVAQHNIPDAFLAAGFVRNCVWDFLHGLASTALNDVDVVYFDSDDMDARRDEVLERDLTALSPDVRWEVKNQARMRYQHNDPAYTSALEAMCFWPEQQTAVGIRLDGSRAVLSPFGLQSLFAGKLSAGPYRPIGIMRERIEKKQWLQRWPKLQVQF